MHEKVACASEATLSNLTEYTPGRPRKQLLKDVSSRAHLIDVVVASSMPLTEVCRLRGFYLPLYWAGEG